MSQVVGASGGIGRGLLGRLQAQGRFRAVISCHAPRWI